MEVELVVAGADDDLAALLGKVRDAGVELDVSVILQGLTQMDELEFEKEKINCLRRLISVFASIPGENAHKFSAGFL